MKKTCWILHHGPIAYYKQTAGIAEALGYDFIEKKVKRAKPWSFLPKHWHAGALHQVQPGFDKLEAPWPDLIISSGQATIPFALAVKKANNDKTKLVFVQKPAISSRYFDAVIAPIHDHASGSNVIETLGATHDLSKEKLEAGAKEFETRFEQFPKPYLSIFLGGSTKKYDFTAKRAAMLAQTILEIAQKYPGTLLISGSRRTGEANMEYFKRCFKDQKNIYLYNNSGKNPYMGMLGLADAIMITDDSVSMLSEAAYTGKPLYILKLPEQEQRKKIQAFIDTLVAKNYARYYTGEITSWEKERLDEVTRIAPALESLIS